MAAAEQSEKTSMLVIVDPQIDFHEGGSLAVVGANADADRLATWIEREGAKITDITVTLDTHQSYHVGHGAYWTDAEGNAPGPFTLIKQENLMINGGKWQAKKEEDRERANAYVKALEESGKFVVCIWPEHCIKGTDGHNVAPAIADALKKWAEKTKKTVTYIEKGQNPHTEMYSALRAEIPVEDDPATQLNTKEIERWDGYDCVIFCGQAASHCVNFTCTDFQANAKKAETIVLTDCQSAVGSFEKQAEDFFERMKTASATLVESTALTL